MKITIGISGTVSRHQKVRIVKVWRGNGYKLNLNRPLGKLTFLSIKFFGKYLCFPVRPDGKLLLGRKKRGFGVSKWNGFGGKIGRASCRERV